MLASVDLSVLLLLAGAESTGAAGAACLVFTAMVDDGAESRVVCGANVEGGAATAATAPAVDVVEAWPRWRCGLA
jgi:hypothetical protein